MSAPGGCRAWLATAPNPGAVAVIGLEGPGAAGIVASVAGGEPLAPHRLRLARLAGIDDGAVVQLGDERFDLMPHAGPRVVQRLMRRLAELGAAVVPEPGSESAFPEAASPIEADMLRALARAASPAAIDPLLAQPRRWRAWRDAGGPESAGEILARSDRWDRLVREPTVVVVGAPNVGKSTLTNRLLGRGAALVADLPGTTRDWVGGLTEHRGVAMRWLDTPGLRMTDDPVEAEAIRLARGVAARADVLIAMRDPDRGWPGTEQLPRAADLRVANKRDLARHTPEPGTLAVGALRGDGVAELMDAVLERLGLAGAVGDGLWAFSDPLRTLLGGGDAAAWERYVGHGPTVA